MAPTPRPAPSIGVGFVVIGSELVTFAVMGVGLDYALGTGPWLTAGLTLLGMLAAVLLTVRLLKAEAAAKSGGRPE